MFASVVRIYVNASLIGFFLLTVVDAATLAAVSSSVSETASFQGVPASSNSIQPEEASVMETQLPSTYHDTSMEVRATQPNVVEQTSIDPSTLQTLVHFSSAGIDDLPSFFGLVSCDFVL